MGSTAIGDALFTATQQRILALLYGQPDRSLYLNEIVRLAGVGRGSVTRELESFCRAGLLTLTRQGNQNHYQANAANPIFSELKGIVLKTFGIAGVLKGALGDLLEQTDIAFVYGSIAKGEEHAASDIDLMLVANDLSYSKLMAALAPAEKQLGRTINPTLFAPHEFAKRLQDQQHFVTRVMDQPKLWLKGETHGSIGQSSQN